MLPRSGLVALGHRRCSTAGGAGLCIALPGRVVAVGRPAAPARVRDGWRGGGAARAAGRHGRSTNAASLGRPIGLLVLGLLGVFAMSQAAEFLGMEDFSITSIEQELADQSEHTNQGGSNFKSEGKRIRQGHITPLSVPQGAVTVLLRPFPWEVENRPQIIACLECAAFALVRRVAVPLDHRVTPADAQRSPYLFYCWVMSRVLDVVSFAVVLEHGPARSPTVARILPVFFVLIWVEPRPRRTRSQTSRTKRPEPDESGLAQGVRVERPRRRLLAQRALCGIRSSVGVARYAPRSHRRRARCGPRGGRGRSAATRRSMRAASVAGELRPGRTGVGPLAVHRRVEVVARCRCLRQRVHHESPRRARTRCSTMNGEVLEVSKSTEPRTCGVGSAPRQEIPARGCARRRARRPRPAVRGDSRPIADVELEHARLESASAGVVVRRVAVVRRCAWRVSARAQRRCDEPALAGDERLGRGEAEDLGVAEAADRCAVGERAERVRGVEDHRDAVRARDVLDAPRVARRAEHVRRQDRARAFEAARPRASVSIWNVVGPALDEPRRAAVPRDRVRRRREREAREHDRAGAAVGERLAARASAPTCTS